MSAHAEAVILASNATGNGEGDKTIRGGKYAFCAEATWGGGNAIVQVKLPQGNYAAVTNATLSANGMVNLDLPPGTYRISITTATAVYARLVKVPA